PRGNSRVQLRLRMVPRIRGVGGLAVALCALAACLQPKLTHCPDVDCPGSEVCDQHGGCTQPQALAACNGLADRAPCSYTDVSGHHVEGECTGGLCVPVACGNGFVQPGEQCDDGNNISGDGCSADCLSTEVCGNGVVDPQKGEQCDDGNAVDGDGCQHDCKLPRCGDGIVDTSLAEESNA